MPASGTGQGLALRQLDRCELTEAGIAGDRQFFLVDENDRLVNGKGLGVLQQIVPNYDEAAQLLTLAFPDGTSFSQELALDGTVDARFWNVGLPVRVVAGPGAVRSPTSPAASFGSSARPGPAPDRMRGGAATLLGTGSLRAMARVVGRRVRVGEAVVVPQGNVGRCAVTMQNPDTGAPDLDTLKALAAYRNDVETTEPLPFGVHVAVAEAGTISLGEIRSCSSRGQTGLVARDGSAGARTTPADSEVCQILDSLNFWMMRWPWTARPLPIELPTLLAAAAATVAPKLGVGATWSGRISRCAMPGCMSPPFPTAHRRGPI